MKPDQLRLFLEKIALRGTVIVLLVSLFSCSVEKNTSLSRNFHNLTSHYNIYFNGKEAYLKGISKAQDKVQNNYTQVLPIFLFEEESVHSVVKGDMKRAIDKSTKVITFHSIKAKPKVKEGDQSAKDKAFYEQNEYNKWVDDCYMLMGQSYMYQGEFFLAIETFKHVLVTYPAQDVRFLAMAWLARAYLMIDEDREAERILSSLTDEREFPEDYINELLLSKAQYDLKREAWSAVAVSLEEVFEYKGLSKFQKIRYTYTLAQLYEQAGEKDLALEKYRQVSRFNPPYEMDFNARVSMAEVFDANSGSSEDLKKLLNKMLRDSKNREYRDQIYFALGNIAMEEGKQEEAIEFYRLSVSTSVQNQYQKGFSSLTLAEIYYEEPDYLLSAAYYDSAVSFLSADYPGYLGLQNLSASLGGLVYNVNTYELEDSVQVLAGLPEDERLAIIDGIIEEVRAEEEETRLAEQQMQQDMAYNQTMMNNNPNSSSGGKTAGGLWYFYNLNAKGFGQPEFRARWGTRKLEDNWRRKNKQSIAPGGAGGEIEGDSINGGDTPIFDNKSREFYLAEIPLNDSSMEQSNLRLEEALFNIGCIYREQLLDYQEAINAFEEELDRFPNPQGRFNARALYYLYDLYNATQNPSRAQAYKTELLRDYPLSHYSMLLSNPNYIQELEEEEMKVVRVYEGVYAAYRQKDCQRVISEADSAIVLYPDDELVPKFKYIKALCVGSTLGKEAMKTELDSLVAQHPGTEESLQAQELIDYMYETFPVIKEAAQAAEAEVLYTSVDSLQEHFFLLALRTAEDVNQVSFDLLNYNLDHFNQ